MRSLTSLRTTPKSPHGSRQPGKCRTGSGGRHYYGTHPVGVKVRSRTGVLAPRVDVRGDGGIAVVPDSRHRSGGHYVLDTNLNLNTAAAAEARDARTMFISLRERSDDLAPEQVPVYALPIPAALLGLIVDDDAKEVETPTSPTPPESFKRNCPPTVRGSRTHGRERRTGPE